MKVSHVLGFLKNSDNLLMVFFLIIFPFVVYRFGKITMCTCNKLLLSKHFDDSTNVLKYFEKQALKNAVPKLV